jgi:hypothetical protein
MSVRSLNGLATTNTSIYINNMFKDGEAIEVIQSSTSTQAEVSLSMKKNTDSTTTLNDTDLFLISDGTTGKTVKYISTANLKNEGTHWTLETIGVGTNLYPDNTGYNLLVGTETNTGGADQSKWSQFRCDGKAEITGALTLGSTIETATGTITLPTGSRTLATLAKAETLTNKTLTLPKISESSGTETYTIAGGSISADRTITLPALGANDIMVCADFAQTLTNKAIDSSNTITSATLTTPKITGGSYKYTLTGASLADNRTLNLPAIITTDTLVCKDFAQTLKNKTLDSSNTLNQITLDNPFIKATGAGGASGYKYSISGANLGSTQQLNLPLITTTDTLVVENLAQNISNKTFSSCVYTAPVFTSLVINDTNSTAITITAEDSANPQSLTIPPLEQNVRFVVGEATIRQTITNTTLDNAVINDPQIKRPEIFDADFSHVFKILGGALTADKDITIPAVADNTEEFVMTKVVQQLTNKALISPFLTTPIINDKDATHEYQITAPFNLADDRICNLPQLTQTNDFVFDKHPQTLTNKTLTDPTIGAIFSDTTTFKKADGTEKFKMDTTNIGIATNFATTKTPPTSQSNTALAGVQIGGGNGSTIVQRWAGASGNDGTRYYMLNFIPPYHTGGPWSFWTEDGSASNFGLSYGSSFLWYADSSLNLIGNQAWSPSDERIKEDIVNADTTECMNIIKRLPLKKYKYKQVLRDKCAGFTQSDVFGWIAQDVKADPVMNNACITSDTAKYYDKETNSILEYEVENLEVINKHRLNAVCWGAISGLIDLVETQQTKITTLEDELESIKVILENNNLI